jgi:hypothetical protein
MHNNPAKIVISNSQAESIEMSSKREKKWDSTDEDDPVEKDDDNYYNQRELHKENVDHLITIREMPSSYLCWSVVSTLCCCFSCFRYRFSEIFWKMNHHL